MSSATTNRAVVPLLLAVAVSLASCSGNYEKLTFSSSEKRSYIDQLESFRVRKNLFFKSNAASPLTIAQRKAFSHLNYYPPNLNLIFRVKLIREETPEKVSIQATGGDTRAAVKLGKFEFETGGKLQALNVYRMIGDSTGELFLPFLDETCGRTSYSGGRYLDLQPNQSGEYILDFNYAYNPYCAYNHNYSCPIVPKANRLDVEIRAGEMKF